MTENYCSECRQMVGEAHSEVECLRAQVAFWKADRDVWKEAWWLQRDATGRVAWQWKEPWMRPHLEWHLGLGPMKDRHGCLGCPMVDGVCPHCGNCEGPP